MKSYRGRIAAEKIVIRNLLSEAVHMLFGMVDLGRSPGPYHVMRVLKRQRNSGWKVYRSVWVSSA